MIRRIGRGGRGKRKGNEGRKKDGEFSGERMMGGRFGKNRWEEGEKGETKKETNGHVVSFSQPWRQWPDATLRYLRSPKSPRKPPMQRHTIARTTVFFHVEKKVAAQRIVQTRRLD